ncbi:hypothetical protein QR680_002561 [Steinernema hermaphroditum]|uniref:FERM domain-containing protein n=1 Tax=Steinernema hermaphroditum TaxID=289476 RepID=A0AA39H350_9BILA|nr:hypothetical protein QR680_002561 [Steinernema hermaphroditum]
METVTTVDLSSRTILALFLADPTDGLREEATARQSQKKAKDMNEGRRSKIYLLDGQTLDILIQPRLLVSELLNIIASHVNLKKPDKQYFGVAYVDVNENYHWLSQDKRVLDFDFPRKSANSDEPVILTHTVQFYVKSLFTFEHTNTINLYFIEAINQLTKGLLKLSFSDYTLVYANLLQYYAGDFESEQSALELVQKAVPKDITFFRTYDKAANDCDQEIVKWYRSLSGISAGQALINVMTRLEKSLTYGVRFYSVRDKGSAHWSLGINTRGIAQYDPSDLLNAKKDFPWDSLEKIYYRDRKFTIEIRDSRRVTDSSEKLPRLLDGMDECDDDLLTEAVNHPTTQVSLSRRAVQPSSSLQVYVFYCANALLCESLWSAATDQHQFYLDQTTASSSQVSRHKQKVEGVIRDLTVKRQRANSQSSFASSLPSLSSLASCTSSSGMPAAKVADGSSASLPSVQSTYNQMTEEERKRVIENYKTLKAKKEKLEDQLLEKLDELRNVCISEGEITGEMPKEIYRTLVPGEPEPKLKRRVGTAFKISPELLSQSSRADKLDQMEADVELHRKIVAAAERLAKDKSMNKSVRKKRRKELEAASQKLKGLEVGLNQLRLSSSKPDVSTAGIVAPGSGGARAWPNFSGHPCSTKAGGSLVAKSCPTTPRGSIPDLYTENELFDRDEEDGTRSSSVAPRAQFQRLSPRAQRAGSVLPPMAPGRRPTVPSVKVSTSSFASDELDNPFNVRSPSLQGFENVGYQSSAPYKSSYRQSNFPTLQNNCRFIRAQSEHSLRQDSPPTSIPGDRQKPLRPSESRSSGLRLYDSTCNPTSWSAPSGVQVNTDVRLSTNSADERLSRWASRMPNYENRRAEASLTPQTTVSQMSTSHSFSGTFATSSLDRRALKMRQSSSSQLPSNAMLLSGTDLRRDITIRAEASSKTTTFPVTQNGSIRESYKPLEKPDVMRYHSNTLSSTKNSGSKPPPPSYSSRVCESSSNNTSASRLPGATDPHMEALLHYYKDAANDTRKSAKTATIV